MLDRVFTPEQEAAIDYGASMQGSLAMEADPGSGKSTTMAEMFRRMTTKDQLVVTKMKRTAADTQKRMPEYVEVTNIDKLSYACAREFLTQYHMESGESHHNRGKRFFMGKASDNKYKNLTLDEIKAKYPDLWRDAEKGKKSAKKRAWAIINAKTDRMVDLINITRSQLLAHTDRDRITAIAAEFGIEADQESLDWLPIILSKGIGKVFNWTPWYDFTDLMYLAVVNNWPVINQYEVVGFDEVQDATPVEIEFAKKLCIPDGIMVLSGDPRQNIMMFAGVRANAFQDAAERCNAKIFRLPKTFRFGKVLAANVAAIKHIETENNGAVDGEIFRISPDMVTTILEPGDACIARYTAYIFKAAIHTFIAGKPVTIVGSEGIRQRVIDTLMKFSDLPFFEIPGALTEWYRNEDLLMKEAKADPVRRGMLRELYDTAFAILTAASKKTRTLEGVLEMVENLFNAGGIEFLTTHKAKGGEWDRVMLVGTEDYAHGGDEDFDRLMSLEWNTKKQLDQFEEENCWFVAATRARKTLFDCWYWREYDPNQVGSIDFPAVPAADQDMQQPIVHTLEDVMDDVLDEIGRDNDYDSQDDAA